VYDNGSGVYVGALRLTIGGGTSRVSFADDGTFLMLCDGASMRRINLGSNTHLTQTLPFTTPTQVIFLGQRFVAVNGSNEFWWSEIDDRTQWPALNFASAQTSADNIVAIASAGGNLWILGERSYEVRGLTSDPDFPFQLIGGSAGNIGCGATGSVCVIGDTVLMLGSVNGQGVAYASSGLGLSRISNHAIEYLLGQLPITDSLSFAYQQEGHNFWVLTLPSLGRTLCFDLTSQMWSERSTANSTTFAPEVWDANCSALCFGAVLFGSRSAPSVWKPDLGTFREWDGRQIIRVYQSPVYWDDLRVLFHQRLQIDFDAGVGLQIGQGNNPQAMLCWSDDGGYTFGNELWESIGRIGEYGWSCVWNMLGMSAERVYRLTISDPVKVIVIGASLTASKAGR
jgi:hypothetical protein